MTCNLPITSGARQPRSYGQISYLRRIQAVARQGIIRQSRYGHASSAQNLCAKDKATGDVAIVESAMREQFALFADALKGQQATKTQATTAQVRINQARGLMPNGQQHGSNRPMSREDHQPGG